MTARQRLGPDTRELRRRSCERKRRYPDHIAALAFAIHEMERQPGLKLDTYRCRFCGGWHLYRAKRSNPRRLFRAQQRQA